MTVTELSELLLSVDTEVTLLDVRLPQERELARIEPSLFIPLQELEERVQELEGWREKALVVYCHHGVRSDYAVRFLTHLGFANVSNLDGGIDAWSLSIDSSVPRY